MERNILKFFEAFMAILLVVMCALSFSNAIFYFMNGLVAKGILSICWGILIFIFWEEILER